MISHIIGIAVVMVALVILLLECTDKNHPHNHY